MQYESAALRVAVRHENHNPVRLLAPVTDIYGLEQTGVSRNYLAYLDPLGEATLRKNSIAVQILLENGGDIDTIVAFDGLSNHTL